MPESRLQVRVGSGRLRQMCSREALSGGCEGKAFAVILPQRRLTVAGSSLARDIDPRTDARRVIGETIEDRAGLLAWRDRVRREFKPVEWSQSAAAVVKGLETTEDAPKAAELELRRRA
jgi:hypothetical protein